MEAHYPFPPPETNPANPTVRLGCTLEHVSHSALDCEQLPRKKLDKPLRIWSQGGKHGCSEKKHIGENLPDLAGMQTRMHLVCDVGSVVQALILLMSSWVFPS